MDEVSDADRALVASPPSHSTVSRPIGFDHGELEALAARCEAAAGPDREIDVAIAVATDWHWDDWEEGESTARGQAEKHGLDWLTGRATEGVCSMWRNIPRVTASIDAAMMLVPEGLSFEVRRSGTGDQGQATIWDPMCMPGNRDWRVKGCATPVLALCAAALRARAAQ